MFDPFGDVQMREVVVDRDRIAMRVPVGRQLLDSLTVEMVEDHVHDKIVYAINGFVSTRKITQDVQRVHLPVPVTWWGAYRVAQQDRRWWRWFGRFALWPLCRRPVAMRTVEVSARWERKAMYPEAEVKAPGFGSYVVIESSEASWRWTPEGRAWRPGG